MTPYDTRADVVDARMARVEALLADIRVDVASMPTVGRVSGMVATMVVAWAVVVVVVVGVLSYLR